MDKKLRKNIIDKFKIPTSVLGKIEEDNTINYPPHFSIGVYKDENDKFELLEISISTEPESIKIYTKEEKYAGV